MTRGTRSGRRRTEGVFAPLLFARVVPAPRWRGVRGTWARRVGCPADVPVITTPFALSSGDHSSCRESFQAVRRGVIPGDERRDRQPAVATSPRGKVVRPSRQRWSSRYEAPRPQMEAGTSGAGGRRGRAWRSALRRSVRGSGCTGVLRPSGAPTSQVTAERAACPAAAAPGPAATRRPESHQSCAVTPLRLRLPRTTNPSQGSSFRRNVSNCP